MLNRVRPLKEGDIPQLQVIYGRAFAGYPWYEELSEETIRNRWETQRRFPGFRCLVCENDESELAGGHWSDEITLSRLEAERGKALADWACLRRFSESASARQARKNTKGFPLVWERELIVDPDFQNKGLGKLLRGEFLRKVEERFSHALILTRLREDNFPSIKVARFHGYQKTGLTVLASQKPLRHEYWYKKL